MTKEQFLNIGEVIVAKSPKTVWTVLGSCVSVVLYSKEYKTGAICHAQLPEKLNIIERCTDYCPKPCYNEYDEDNALRFVSCAISFMLDKLNKTGIPFTSLNAGIYGGSNRFQFMIDNKTIGERNVEIARKLLKGKGIRITKEDVGGSQSRKIIFNLETGKVEVIVH